MTHRLHARLEELEVMSLDELRAEYKRLIGKRPFTLSRRFLCRRILWGDQAQQEGGLASAFHRRVKRINRSDALTPRHKGTTIVVKPKFQGRDPRLPEPGSLIQKYYRGRQLSIHVLDEGFEWEGTFFPTLSGLARAITGSHWNGYRFFGLHQPGGGL